MIYIIIYLIGLVAIVPLTCYYWYKVEQLKDYTEGIVEIISGFAILIWPIGVPIIIIGFLITIGCKKLYELGLKNRDKNIETSNQQCNAKIEGSVNGM